MFNEIVKGLILLLINGGLGAGFFCAMGASFWIVLLVLALHDIVYVMLVYYGLSGIVVNILGAISKRIGLDKIIQRYRNNFCSDKKKRFQEKFVNWMTNKGAKITLIISFIPICPLTATAVAARWLKIKFGLIVLIIAATFKAILVCLFIYNFFEWLSLV